MSDSFQRRAYKILDRLISYELDKAFAEYSYSSRVGNSHQRAFNRLDRLSNSLMGFGRVGKRIAEAKGLPTDDEWEDSLHGGKGDRKTPGDFEKKELEKGQKVELEHTDDYDLALEIALDHESEFPPSEDTTYYDELDKMEKKLKKNSEILPEGITPEALSLYEKMKELDGKVYWRFQPKGASLDHKSMTYTGEEDVDEGVWAFSALFRALSDITEGTGSYMDQVRRDSGGVGELVAIKGGESVDDYEDFNLIVGGEIVARFDMSPLEAIDRGDLEEFVLSREAKKKSEDEPMGNQTIGDNPLEEPVNDELPPTGKSLNAPSRRPQGGWR